MSFRTSALAFVKDLVTDEDVQASLEALFARLVKNHVSPLVPIAVNLAVPIAVKTAMDELRKSFPGADDLIDGAIDVAQVAQETRVNLDRLIPDIDIGIPALDAMIDSWRPKTQRPNP